MLGGERKAGLLLAITGIKDRSVLIGRTKPKIVKGKKYYYPGLIQVLQDYNLVIAEVDGDGPLLRYTFHVNMTPGLLTDEQLGKLPELLQKKHAQLLERCEASQRKLEAKKRPPKLHPNDDKSVPKQAELQGIGNSNTPSWNFQYKQQPINNTHRTGISAREDDNNNSGDNSDPQNDVVVALIDHGISKRVAQRLAHRYKPERIMEKLDFLEFLSEETPEKVQNPQGWLRRAIEEDYGPPDGFLSKEERERLVAEETKRSEEEQQRAEAAEERNRAFQEKNEAERAASIRRLREEYDTREEDLAFWEQAKMEIEYTAIPEITSLISELEMLRIRDGTVALGAWTEAAWRRLQHPGTVKVISRALGQIAGQPLEIETVTILQDLRKNHRDCWRPQLLTQIVG